MLREDLPDKVTVEQRPKGGEGASWVDIWRKYLFWAEGVVSATGTWPNRAEQAKGNMAGKRVRLGRVGSKSHRILKTTGRTLDFTMSDESSGYFEKCWGVT